jgi:hypothetical protein
VSGHPDWLMVARLITTAQRDLDEAMHHVLILAEDPDQSPLTRAVPGIRIGTAGEFIARAGEAAT